MQKLFILLVLSLSCIQLKAQEMNFEVSINTPKLQTVDPKIFEELENTITDFLNNTKWTDKNYAPEERINANLQINITEEVNPTTFKADFQIQATRPIYGSTDETVLISNYDKTNQFTYEQFQPVQFSENSFQDNLSSILAYYVYVILGLDGDSFAPFGGEEYFRKAQEIINTVPSNLTGVYKGWRPVDGDNSRYFLVESILNSRARPYRQGMYDYHLNGVDMMHKDVVTARAVMGKVIGDLAKVEKAYPNAMILQVFANSKNGEIVEIFKLADTKTKETVKKSMTQIDAANAAIYRRIGR